MPAPRFSNFRTRLERRAVRPGTGASRVGVRGDLAALLDPKSERASDISVERAAVLIRTFRYADAADSTAPTEALGVKSSALYEFLMAHARGDLVGETEFTVPFSAAKAFLQVTPTARLRQYMTDLTNTWVSYEFKEKDGVEPGRRTVQLLRCSEDVDASGERCIRYSLPDVVRQAILAAKGYTWLELAPFAKFSSKYAARLYPILALRAGMSFERPHPISVTPEDLADQLGWDYKPGEFKFANFEHRCLLPALADISLHVRRFQVTGYDRIEADTRGRPVTRILLTVSKASRPLSERQKAEVSPQQVAILKALMIRRGMDVEKDLPVTGMLARAATVLNIDVIETANRWANALDRARETPSLSVGQNFLFDGSELIAALEHRGVGHAFELWMRDPEEPSCVSGRYDLRNLPPLDPDYVEVDMEPSAGRSTRDVLEDFINSVCDPV